MRGMDTEPKVLIGDNLASHISLMSALRCTVFQSQGGLAKYIYPQTGKLNTKESNKRQILMANN